MMYQLEQTVPARLSLRINERFGDHAPTMISKALDTLCEAKERLGFVIKGFVSSSGRSLVAEVEMHGLTGICKVPFVYASVVIRAIVSSARDGSGPGIIHEDEKFVIMEKVEGTQAKLDLDLVHTVILAAERRAVDRLSFSVKQVMSMVVSESGRRATRSAHVDTFAKLLRVHEAISKSCDRLQSFQCHGDASVRNVIDTGDRLYFIDPEPVIAPVEFDVAKLLSFGNALDIDLVERGELRISDVVEERLAPFADALSSDQSLDYQMITWITEFFLLVRGISSSAFTAYERQINW